MVFWLFHRFPRFFSSFQGPLDRTPPRLLEGGCGLDDSRGGIHLRSRDGSLGWRGSGGHVFDHEMSVAGFLAVFYLVSLWFL